tara:strand:- start:557 stop:1714 length:1158 start_codon:yes stop_codon:yes gene_type:complete
MEVNKIIRITTVPISIEKLLENQPRFFSQFYKVILVSSQKEKLVEIGKNQGVSIFYLPLSRRITPLRDLIATFKLYRFLMKEKPAIVHTHTPKAGIVGMLASFLARVPIRMHTVAGLPLMEARGLKRLLLNHIEAITYFFATNVYPNSFGLSKFILEQNFCDQKKIKVLCNGSSNGINTDYFNPKDVSVKNKNKIKNNLGILNKDFVYSFIGRLVGDKGINELVIAFKKINNKHNNSKLLLVGDIENDLDPLKKETINEINLNSNIILAGYQKDIRPFLAITHCFVFPSYREGFPNVILQAGAMNVPCIVSNINGCNEIIKNLINGLIIQEKNIEDLEKSMLTLYEDDRLRLKLAKKSRSIIIENYQQEKIWEALKNEYKSLENV